MLRTSETTSAISLALCNALVELEDVKKEGSANIPTKSGGSFSYRYATLPNILQSVRGTLGKHDLAIIQNATTGDEGHVYIWTMLCHSSGEFMVFDPLPMPIGNTAQETGSAITYGRRYHLLAVLGLAAEDDDDGATAAPRQSFQQSTSNNSTNVTVRGPLQGMITEKQAETIRGRYKAKGVPAPIGLDGFTKQEASNVLDALSKGTHPSEIPNPHMASPDDEEPF